MTEIDADLVRRKLASLLRNLEDLGSIEALTLREYAEAVEGHLRKAGF